jgi:hypothetical protein
MATGILESPARVLRQLLLDLGECVPPQQPNTAEKWQAHVNVEPNAPDEVVTVYNTTPVMDGRLMQDGTRLEKPGIQVRVRAAQDQVNGDGSQQPNSGHVKARSICVALDGVYRERVTVNGVDYLVQEVARSTGVVPIGYETPNSKRFVYTINLKFTVGLWPDGD